MEKINIAVVGSRSFNDYHQLLVALNDYIRDNDIIYGNIVIVSGGATGADTLAYDFAKAYDIETKIFKPEWKKFGRKAGFMRNKDIIDAADVVFAFWDGKSKGTKHSIDLAKKSNKELYVLKY